MQKCIKKVPKEGPYVSLFLFLYRHMKGLNGTEIPLLVL